MTMSDELANDVELLGLLREHASRGSVPGAALGVLRDGVVTTAYWGLADVRTGEPVSAETRFSIGSLTKSMTATVIAQLAEGGHLSLDDAAVAHVPELRGVAWAEARLRDLLANRSGLPLLASLEFAGIAGMDAGVLSRFATSIAAAAPTSVPWSYANAGWCLLGRAIETITRLEWEDAMIAWLFRSLGMNETTFATRATYEPRAAGHEGGDGSFTTLAAWRPRAYGPAGSTVLSTVRDLLRFAAAHLSDPTLADLRRRQAEIRIHGWLDAWCSGWAWFDWDGGDVWGWDGVLPGQRAVLRLVPQHRAAIVLLTNGSRGRALYRSLFADLMRELFAIRLPPLRLEPSHGAARDLDRYEGVYEWPDRRWTVRASDDRLILSGATTSVEARPLDARIFVVDANDADNPTVTFDAFGSDGRPAILYRMLWGYPRS